MQPGPWIRDISRQVDGIHLSADERAQLARLDISVSDTETTGRPPQDLGLTELASQRATLEPGGTAKHWMFHAHILPLRPQYQDYLAACARAKRNGTPPPPYDRRRYEYEIDPGALRVTGTELLRDGLNGPIIGMKVNGAVVKQAVPFYKVMEDFLAFTRNGERDTYYNMPFDARVLAGQVADVRAYELARSEQYRDEAFLARAASTLNEQAAERLAGLAHLPYAEMTAAEQRELVQLLKPMVPLPASYTNPATFRCLYHGYLAQHGFDASNRLDDAYRKLVDPAFDKRGDHRADEDVTMAARVALKLAGNETVPDIAGLYGMLIGRVDPAVQVVNLPPRIDAYGRRVEGDLRISFGRHPDAMDAPTRKLWDYLTAFKRAENANPSIPKHLIEVDTAAHSITINAERSSPLSLNLLKKLSFFMQLHNHPVIDTLVPHHSTGTEMDVVLHAQGSRPRTTVENVHYASLRANLAFLSRDPARAGEYLQLIAAMHKADDRVGMVLLRPRADGGLDIALQGQVKAFGEVVLHLPADAPVAAAIPSLQRELAEQMKLGAIPHVANHGLEEEEQFQQAEGSEYDPLRQPPAPPLSLSTDERGDHIRLRVSEPIAELMAYRLGSDLKRLVKQKSFSTAAGSEPVAIRRVTEGEGDARKTFYEFNAQRAAFHSFVNHGDGQAQGERPSNLIKDASWLLYRLEQLPGTYGLALKDGIATLHQRDGVSVEALGLLHGVGIPFTAHGDRIELNARQLMPNAFHWSVALSRRQKERMGELREGRIDSALAPAAFLGDNVPHLLQHARASLKTSEGGKSWLLDGSRTKQGEPRHFPLPVARPAERPVVFHKGRVVPQESGLQNIAQWELQPRSYGRFRLTGNPVLVRLAMHQLGKEKLVVTQDGVEVLPQHEQDARRALRDASGFMGALGDATGSQRLQLERAWLDNESTVVLELPSLQFLQRPRLFVEMMEVNRRLARQEMDVAITDLQQKLPDPVQADDRRDDPVKMCDAIVACAGTLRGLSMQLDGYLKLLGGGAYRDDQSALSLSGELKEELAMLGTLLHEMDSTASMLRDGTAPPPALRAAIASAQGRLSDVAYGAGHLREDLAVARKRIESFNKQGKRDRGLIREAGKAMAALMGDYANGLALSGADLPTAMQQYRALCCALLDRDAETLEPYTERATLRSLLRYHRDPSQMHPAALEYLLGESFPALDARQRNAVMGLYRSGDEAALKQCMQPDEAALWLRQYRLLTGQEPVADSFTAWRQTHQASIAAIEEEIRTLYMRRGHRYRKVAQLYEAGGNAEEHAQAQELRQKATASFRRAGMDDAQIDKAFRRGGKRPLSARDAEYSREIVGMETGDSATIPVKALQATIDAQGHEAQYRARRQQHAYDCYRDDVTSLVQDADDPDFTYKQRRSMLTAVKHHRKESHDVLMGKRHFHRDLQALLVLGQQDPRVNELFADEEKMAIRTIGEAIRGNPEMVGLHEDTVAQIHGTLRQLDGALQQNMQQYLQHYGVSSQAAEHRITCDMTALERMYDKAKPKKPMPAHMDAWVNRVTSKLQQSRGPVQSYGVELNDRTVPVTLALSADAGERTRQWAHLELALAGTGIQLPAMPDTGGEHKLPLRFSRAVERGTASFDRSATRRDAAHALRQFAIGQGMKPQDAEALVRRSMRHKDTLEGLRAEAYRKGMPTETFDGMFPR